MEKRFPDAPVAKVNRTKFVWVAEAGPEVLQILEQRASSLRRSNVVDVGSTF